MQLFELKLPAIAVVEIALNQVHKSFITAFPGGFQKNYFNSNGH